MQSLLINFSSKHFLSLAQYYGKINLTEAYPRLPQTSKMQSFETKNNINFRYKMLHPRCLLEPWTRLYQDYNFCVSPLHKKISFPLKIFSVNMTKSVFLADLVTITKEILNGNLHFRAVPVCYVSKNQDFQKVLKSIFKAL